MRAAARSFLIVGVVGVLAGAGACGGGPARRPETRKVDEEVTLALTEAVKLIRANRLVDAETRLATARQRAIQDTELLELLDYYLATVMVYRGDLMRAQRLVGAHAKRAAVRGDSDSEAWMQSSSAWLRWSAGDRLGAVAENERISAIIGAETQLDAMDRRALLLSQLWDRAFFRLDLAMSLEPADRGPALTRALEARDEFDALAREPDDHAEIQLLTAYFAVRQGDAQAAARAVRDLAADPGGDARGLYVQIVVLDAVGEDTGALRLRLKNTVTLLTPLLERALGAPSVSATSSSAS